MRQFIRRRGCAGLCFDAAKILRLPAALFLSAWFLTSCNTSGADDKAGAPPPLKVESVDDRNLFKVERPERFALAVATAHDAVPELKATGTVNPDVSRNVPVISLAAGRVVEIKARLGDNVKKGQVLLRVQSADISGAFSDYRKAKADEEHDHGQHAPGGEHE